ncbi:MAG: DUF6629 family protein [Bacteroidia bacterium]
MCFSAGASFGAAIVLSSIGIASIKKVQKPYHVVFAAIPLIFAVQQLSEGILWTTLPNPDDFPLQQAMTYLFLFFAQILWPLYVPVSLWLLEEDPKREKIQKVLVGIGAIVASYLLYCLLTFHVEANIIGMGFSRIYLCVHYLSDVLGGFAIGFVWLIFSIAILSWLDFRKEISVKI